MPTTTDLKYLITLLDKVRAADDGSQVRELALMDLDFALKKYIGEVAAEHIANQSQRREHK